MKWNYLFPRLALAGIIWSFFAFAFDPLVRSALVQVGSALTGTTVDVYDLETGFFPPSIKTGPACILSPRDHKSYLACFDQMQLKFSGKPLLHRKLIVETASISGMELFVPRDLTDEATAVPQDSADSGRSVNFGRFRRLSSQLGQSGLDILKTAAAEQLDPGRLETVRVSKTIEGEWKQRFQAYDTRLQQVKREIDSVENSVKTAEGKTLDKIKTYAQSAERVDQLVNEGKQIRNELNSLPQIAQQDYQRIERAKEQDLANLDRLLDSVSPDPHKILHTLVGDELSQQIEQVFGWTNFMFQTVQVMKDEQEPERIQGEWIDFRSDVNAPDILFKDLRISGFARRNQERIPFLAVVKELSSTPRQYQQPIRIQAQIDGQAEIKVAGELKYYEDEPAHEFVVLFKLPQQKKIKIENSDRISLALVADQTECRSHLTFREHDFQCQIEFSQTPVRFEFDSSRPEAQSITRLLQQSLSAIDSLSVNVHGSGSYDRPEWRIESALGQQVARGLTTAFQAELARGKQELAAEIEQLANQEREKLIQKLNQEYSAVLAELEVEESKVQSVIQKVSGRPLGLRGLLR
ncbi:TIGR03545 family protein [Gimesia sp.]|uniref:TIGR03545 family protein n=1 Tax=Gimesia sp. TaxID=2024833 RepID=UPI003A91E8DB